MKNMKIIRFILSVVGLFFLAAGVTLLWGKWLPWYSSYLLGSTLIAYSIAILWTAAVESYKALLGGGLSCVITFGGSAIYALRLGHLWIGQMFLYVAVISLWFFYVGLKAEHKSRDPLSYSLRWLFSIVMTIALIEGIYLLIPLPFRFAWVLIPDHAVIYGWMLVGGSLFFGWSLLRPKWENGYPALYALIAYDLLLIGPFLRLFRAPVPVVIIPFYLWAAVIVILGSGIWSITELCKRLFRK